MTQSYEFNSYFAAGKTRYWAEYVDKSENGGNNNGHVDGKEIELFKNIIEHRYQGYKYSFDKLDSEQSAELNSYDRDGISKNLYMDNKITQGSFSVGWNFSDKLGGYSNESDYNWCKHAMTQIANFPVKEKQYTVIKEFLMGYEGGDATNGVFEQMGSEYGDAFKNKDVLPLLKAILDNVPESKRGTEEYQFVEKVYNDYSKKDPEEKFTDSTFSAISSFFGCNTLDNLDEAVTMLYNIP